MNRNLISQWSLTPMFGKFVGIVVLAIVVAISGCWDNPNPEATPVDQHPAAQITNRVDIPGPVRSNLGITFASVERRPVTNTIRVPGRFELLPTARAEHHTPLRGRVEVLVQQLQPVKKGDVLYRLDSPNWRDLQQTYPPRSGRSTSPRHSSKP